jgi:hypothetical protein
MFISENMKKKINTTMKLGMLANSINVQDKGMSFRSLSPVNNALHPLISKGMNAIARHSPTANLWKKLHKK